MNPEAPEYSLNAGEIIDFEGTAVANLEFTAVVDTITVRARS